MAAPTETKTLTFLLGNGNWKKSYICFCPVLEIDTKKKKSQQVLNITVVKGLAQVLVLKY